MPRISQSAALSEEMVNRAAEWYRHNAIPAAFRGVNPLILRKARRLSGGDWRRCVVDNDGSVTVHNHPVWSPTSNTE